MKHLFTTIIALSFVMTPLAHGLTVFEDDFEDTLVFDRANATVGRWDGAPALVTDDFFAGIPPPLPDPDGMGQFVRVTRPMLAVAAYTATTDNFFTVHAEFDMYFDEAVSGATNFTIYGMLHDLRMFNEGRPDPGWFPHIDVRESTGMTALFNDLGTWNVVADLGPRPTADAWHSYSFDYTVGVTTTLVLTVDGVSTNVPPPWGWSALGQDEGDPPGTREAAVQLVGLAWYANETPSVAYVDNVLITYENGSTHFLAAVTSASMDNVVSSLSFESIDGVDYGLQYTEDIAGTNLWTTAEWSVVGAGGINYVFDSNNPTGDVTRTYRIIIQ